MSRTAIAILSNENLIHNVNLIKKIAVNSKIIGMFKANAYGHGLRSVSLRLANHVDLIGVASIDEAMALRKVGVKTPIILMEGIFEPNELSTASTQGFHSVFHDWHQLEWLQKILTVNNDLMINAWLKIDTGMGRLGFMPDQTLTAYQQLLQHANINTTIGILSHLACAEIPDHPLNQKQIQRFQDVTHQLPGNHLKSLCNSAGIFSFPDQHHQYVRPGLALFGISPFANRSAASLGLKPVMTLKSTLIAIKTIPKGESIGYGDHYHCHQTTKIGIVAFGYGDGYPQDSENKPPVLVNQKKCRLIGQVSMDMTAVDLASCPEARVGDPVTLWGDGLPVEEVASYTNNSVYKLLTGVQNRVKFQRSQPLEHPINV